MNYDARRTEWELPTDPSILRLLTRQLLLLRKGIAQVLENPGEEMDHLELFSVDYTLPDPAVSRPLSFECHTGNGHYLTYFIVRPSCDARDGRPLQYSIVRRCCMLGTMRNFQRKRAELKSHCYRVVGVASYPSAAGDQKAARRYATQLVPSPTRASKLALTESGFADRNALTIPDLMQYQIYARFDGDVAMDLQASGRWRFIEKKAYKLSELRTVEPPPV